MIYAIAILVIVKILIAGYFLPFLYLFCFSNLLCLLGLQAVELARKK
jgi:hypothetical protein